MEEKRKRLECCAAIIIQRAFRVARLRTAYLDLKERLDEIDANQKDAWIDKLHRLDHHLKSPNLLYSAKYPSLKPSYPDIITKTRDSFHKLTRKISWELGYNYVPQKRLELWNGYKKIRLQHHHVTYLIKRLPTNWKQYKSVISSILAPNHYSKSTLLDFQVVLFQLLKRALRPPAFYPEDVISLSIKCS